MKKCKSCKMEIDAKATKCPHCQTDQRSWFRRHPILTVLGAIFVFSILFGSSAKNKNVTTKPETKEAGAITGKPIENKVETPAPTKTQQEILIENLTNTINKIGSDMSYRGIQIENSDPDRPKGTKTITVSVDTKSFFDKSSLLRTTGKVSSGLFQVVFGDTSLNAYDVFVWYYGETTDKYGNKKDSVVLTYDIDKLTYDKINWQNFDQSNLCNFLEQEEASKGSSGTFDTGCKVLVNIQ